MNAEAARGGSPAGAKQSGNARSALLWSAVLACIVSGPRAEARDFGPPDRDLPCNDLCRSWMSWRAEPPLAAADRPVPPARGERVAARHGYRVVPAFARPSARARAKWDDESRRPPEPVAVERVAQADRGSIPRWRPPPAQVGPPLKRSALVSTPIDPAEAGRFDRSVASRRPAAGVEPARDVFRLDADPADAAILGRPLFQPTGNTDAELERPETPGGRMGEDALAQGTGPISAAIAARRVDHDPTDTAPPRPENLAAIDAVPSSVAIPAADRPPPVPAAAAPSPPRRNHPARPVAAPALPISDLEQLDGTERRQDRATAAPTTASASPNAGVLLLGGLAVLSLIGGRRRRVIGDAT